MNITPFFVNKEKVIKIGLSVKNVDPIYVNFVFYIKYNNILYGFNGIYEPQNETVIFRIPPLNTIITFYDTSNDKCDIIFEAKTIKNYYVELYKNSVNIEFPPEIKLVSMDVSNEPEEEIVINYAECQEEINENEINENKINENEINEQYKYMDHAEHIKVKEKDVDMLENSNILSKRTFRKKKQKYTLNIK